MIVAFWLAGCGLSRCEALCADKADCIEEELVAYETSWAEWTGFESRAGYEEACLGVFEDGREEGASRHEQQKACRAERRRTCDGGAKAD